MKIKSYFSFRLGITSVDLPIINLCLFDNPAILMFSDAISANFLFDSIEVSLELSSKFLRRMLCDLNSSSPINNIKLNKL